MKQHGQFEAYRAKCPIVAILRGITPPEVPAVCDALYEAGILLLEIPLNSPEPLKSIETAARHGAGRQLVGAGTVLTPQDVRDVAAAGGEFIISPNTDADVIRETVQAGLISMPGFMTASEGFAALKAGANYLKLFPAGQLGPGYIKDLKAVIKAPILAVGGVNADNLKEFLKTCSGVGIGSSLYKPGMTPADVLAAAKNFTGSL